ncbi:MAG: hypothetical protein VCC99_14020 [Alphaproteobacteria bacterium]
MSQDKPKKIGVGVFVVVGLILVSVTWGVVTILTGGRAAIESERAEQY